MSCPHFLMGDPKYINGVVGMHPSQKEHGTFLDVEPVSTKLRTQDGSVKLHDTVSTCKSKSGIRFRF